MSSRATKYSCGRPESSVSYRPAGRPAERARLNGFFLEVIQEFAVVGSLGQALEDALGRLGRAGRILADEGEHAAEQPDLAQRPLIEEQLLAAGAAARDVDRREDTALGELAVEVQLHVAGALELLVDHVVHA